MHATESAIHISIKYIQEQYNQPCCHHIIGGNLIVVDAVIAKIEFLAVIDISDDLMRLYICKRMWYNGDTIDQIRIGFDVDNVFNGITVTIDIPIKIPTLILLLDTLTIIHDVGSDSDKLSKYKYGHDNNHGTTIIIKSWYKIGADTFILGLFLAGIYFILAMDRLLINMIVIEFDAVIVSINQLVLILGVYSSIVAVHRDTQIICHVCVVFFYLLIFCHCFSFFF